MGSGCNTFQVSLLAGYLSIKQRSNQAKAKQSNIFQVLLLHHKTPPSKDLKLTGPGNYHFNPDLPLYTRQKVCGGKGLYGLRKKMVKLIRHKIAPEMIMELLGEGFSVG